MKKLKFKKSYVSISGDYYQILFDDDLDEQNDPTDADEVMDSQGPYFPDQKNSFISKNLFP